MASGSKLPTKRARLKHSELTEKLDVSSATTATAFRAAAKAYTERATKTKAAAVKTLHRERILTKAGEFTKTYAAKG
jgi:hypothetical protein